MSKKHELLAVKCNVWRVLATLVLCGLFWLDVLATQVLAVLAQGTRREGTTVA